MGLNGKEIICSVKDKFEAALITIEKMIDDMSSIVTVIFGKDVKEKDANNLIKKLENKYKDIDFDLVNGNQPVYSFIIGVE